MSFSKSATPTRKRGQSTTSRVSLVLLGAGGVGKSCIVLRLLTDDFATEYDPTIEDTYRQPMRVDNRSLVLDIMDTAGQEEFYMLEDQWIRDGQGFMLVFDSTDISTVEEMQKKYVKICRQREGEECPIMLVAAKIDLVTKDGKTSSPATEKAKALAKQWGSKYIETSALTNHNIVQCFEEGVRQVWNWEEEMAKKKGNQPQDTKWCTFL